MPAAKQTPQIIAHRGSSRDLPEHTLKAYLRAIAEGADALECDVRLTADSHLVCAHDRKVDRTSNGRGMVSTLELATLEGLDFGSWKLAHGGEVEMPDVDRERDKLLTLRRLIDVVMSCGREVGLVIETKHPTRYAGQVERQLAKVLTEFGLQGSYVAGSAPRARDVVLAAGDCPDATAVSAGAAGLPHEELGAPAVPRRVAAQGGADRRAGQGDHPALAQDREEQHDRGNQVYVFTVDDEADIDMCLELGVDAIISNRPAFVRDRLCVRG